jgi:hypothetical protein
VYPVPNAVPVFDHHQIPNIKKSEPICYAEKENAVWMVGRKIADWRNNYKAIQLRRAFLADMPKDARLDRVWLEMVTGNIRLMEMLLKGPLSNDQSDDQWEGWAPRQ